MGFVTSLVASQIQKRFGNQPEARTISERLKREFLIDFASFFFSLSVVAWICSTNYWHNAAEERELRVEEQRHELEDWYWEWERSTRPENYPDGAKPNDPWGAMIGSDAPIIDLEYETKIQPGYAPKF